MVRSEGRVREEMDKEGGNHTLFDFLVRIGHGGITVNVVPHLTLVNDLGWVARRYESGNLPLGFTPCERSLEVPIEGGTLPNS